MMQPSPLLFALGLFGAFNMVHGNQIVEEHDDLTHGTGVLQEHAGVDAPAVALSKWPSPTTSTTVTDVKTITPDWSTSTLVTAKTSTTNEGKPTLLAVTHLQDKRAESSSHHASRTVVVLQNTHSSVSRQGKILVVPGTPSTPPVAKPTKVLVVPGTSTVPTPVLYTTTVGGQALTLSSHVVHVSVTTVKPLTETTTVHEKTTTSAPARGVIVVVPEASATTTTTPVPSATPSSPTNATFIQIVGGSGLWPDGHYFQDERNCSVHNAHTKDNCSPRKGIYGESCEGGYHVGCHISDFVSKKWLWLLTIPIALLLASVPLCIWAVRRLTRRSSPSEKMDYAAAPAAAPAAASAAAAPAQTTTVAGDGKGTVGRQAEEGRGRTAFPAGQTPAQNPTQTVTTATPSGKVTTVPATTEHVETVAQHDGADDMGSLRARKQGRSPLNLRW